MKRSASRPALRAFGIGSVALVATLVAGGCQSIVGIPDRSFDAASQQCVEYCNTVQKNCTGDNAVYPDKSTCLALCNNLPNGDASQVSSDNSVACRLRFARAASGAASEQCGVAGPDGDGSCGSSCESYCTLFQKVCPDQFGIVPDCQTKCAAIASHKGFSVSADQNVDTVECRIAELGKATADPTKFCASAEFQSSDCKNDAKTTATCEDYCRAVGVACTGKLQQYDSTAQCMAVCADLTAGTYGDTNGNTVGCRYYHSFNALVDPATHCPHASAGGDGVCSTDNCESYCELMKKGCSATFTSRYPGGLTACETDCGSTIQGGGAGVLYKGGVASKMVSCLHSISKAIADKSDSECAALQGDGC